MIIFARKWRVVESDFTAYLPKGMVLKQTIYGLLPVPFTYYAWSGGKKIKALGNARVYQGCMTIEGKTTKMPDVFGNLAFLKMDNKAEIVLTASNGEKIIKYNIKLKRI